MEPWSPTSGGERTWGDSAAHSSWRSRDFEDEREYAAMGGAGTATESAATTETTAWRGDGDGDVEGEDEDEDDDLFALPQLNQFPVNSHDSNAFDDFNSFRTMGALQRDTQPEFLSDFPPDRGAGSVRSDEFVDAETFLADHKPGRDSFLEEVGEANINQEDWADGHDAASNAQHAGNGGFEHAPRPSDIFVERSRDLDKVAFTSPRSSTTLPRDEQEDSPEKATKPRPTRASAALSESGTAMSSENDIHVDNRLVLTPNSFKTLKDRVRRRAFDSTQTSTLSDSNSSNVLSSAQHSYQAKAYVRGLQTMEGFPSPQVHEPPSSAEKALQGGPSTIKRALHEIDSMLYPIQYDSESSSSSHLVKLKFRLKKSLTTSDHEAQDEESHLSADGDSTDNELDNAFRDHTEQRTSRGEESMDKNANRDRIVAETGTQTLTDTGSTPSQGGSDAHKLRLSGLTGNRSANTGAHWERTRLRNSIIEPRNAKDNDRTTATRSYSAQTRTPVDSRTTRLSNDGNQLSHDDQRDRKAELRFEDKNRDLQEYDANYRGRHGVPRRSPPILRKTHDAPRSPVRSGLHHVVTRENVSQSWATTLPSEMSRRCRRLLCAVGEQMIEQIVFSNGSDKVARICVSLLPLSTGCQQFSISPAVLELRPRSSQSFTVTFDAQFAGVVAGIFQFRAVGADSLCAPYEVLLEASVRGDLTVARRDRRAHKPPRKLEQPRTLSAERQVKELSSQILSAVQISPTFVRFGYDQPSSGAMILDEEVRILNTSSEHLKFQIKCSHEHIKVTPSRGEVSPGTDVSVVLTAICRPFAAERRVNGDGSTTPREKWCGSMTVIVGDVLSREISLVLERNVLAMLPPCDEAARSRHAVSNQTDSFYYTKRVNRRGLYFHARAVECGSCVVGESHQVPVYICNGSNTPVTVFLQALQEPFSCSYTPTTLQARKFIEVPVTFKPKAKGKVATSLVAYSVDGKAAVTLIARGVEASP